LTRRAITVISQEAAKKLLPALPALRLAGFVTHATYLPEGGDRRQR